MLSISRRHERLIRLGAMSPTVPAVAAAPDGYLVKRVRSWGDEVMQSYGYDVTRGGHPVGQFQVVTCYVIGAEDKWIGTWSAISNYNKLSHAQMMKLANMQLLEHGYPMGLSDAQLIGMKNLVLPDGYTLQQKMGWLYQNTTGKPGCIMWGDGEWWSTSEAHYGTMVNGGQLVAVSKNARVFTVTMPGRTASNPVIMRQLWTFKAGDFGKSHAEYPWLSQWATVANLNNTYGDTIRGHVLCPVALEPSQFDFGGTFNPTSYWLPDVWLESV